MALSYCVIYLLLLATADITTAQSGYGDWLQQQDSMILQVPPRTTQSLQIPLDIQIYLDSSNEQCVPETGPYCIGRSNFENEVCPNGGSIYPCDEVQCENEPPEPLSNSRSPTLQFFSGVYRTPVESDPECGLTISQDNTMLEFTAPSDCNDEFKQPFLVSSVYQNGSTISFTIDTDVDDGIFLEVAAMNEVELFSTVLTLQEGVVISNTTIEYGESSYKKLVLGEFAVVATEQGYSIFSEGDIALLVERNVDAAEIKVGFGSSEFRGTFKDIKMYNAAASTNEIYSLYSGEPLAEHYIRPDCACPRGLIDSFGLIRSTRFVNYPVEPDNCYGTYYTSRYNGDYSGKWSIFSNTGWISDFTQEALLVFRMHQPMLTYGISGEFGAKEPPRSIEVSIIGQDSKPRAVVYISLNCTEEHNMTSTALPQFSEIYRRRYSRAVHEIEPKCYHMDDIVYEYTDYNEYYQEYNQMEMTGYGFEIPLLHPNDADLLLSDAFVGDINMKLKGHRGYKGLPSGPQENWYFVKNLYLNARPHCGGYPFTVVGPPKIMSEYYEFHKPSARGYTCHCPEGIIGDMCESCGTAPGTYRYMKEPDVCADCGCSDLTISDSQQCDQSTGQCDCSGDVDLELAGKHCDWYISDIGPLKGQVVGGTRVKITSRYFNGFGISFTASINGSTYDLISYDESDEVLQLVTPPSYHMGNSSIVDLVVTAKTVTDNSDNGIGPLEKFYKFEYGPNAILADIQPRTTIIGGGIILTVSGKFFDFISSPYMVTYLSKDDVVIDNFTTDCQVISSEIMHCVSADVRADAAPLLIFAPNPEVTTRSTTRLTTTSSSSTATTTVQDLPTTDYDYPVTTGEDDEVLFSTTEIPAGRRRRRRSGLRTKRDEFDKEDLNNNYYNDNNGVQFSLGFVFDDYDEYIDLINHPDKVFQELAIIYTYLDPSVERFVDDVMEYDPKKEPLIRLKGDWLDYGAKMNDYTIEIGAEYCTVEALTSNEIGCKPPDTQPDEKGFDWVNYKNKRIPHMQVVVGNLKFAVGHVYYLSNIWTDNAAFRGGMIFLIVVACLAPIGVVAFIKFRSYRKGSHIEDRSSAMELETPSSRYITQPGQAESSTCFKSKMDVNIQANVERCTIPSDRLTMGKQLGKGNFGTVYKGQLVTHSGKLRTVAVKSLKDDKEVSVEDMENFLLEGTLMINFKHKNVMSLIGVVMEEGERPLVVLPYMENGDLCTVLRKEEMSFTLADMLHFGYQIANGMAYLANERFVHRDLAARNCMIDGSFIVKIADFGMSKDVYGEDYYRMESMNKPLPIKWMAIESVKEGRFTTKSDVWSYGVTMWELLTRGGTPYPGINNYNVREYIVVGNRLDKPTFCPPIVYEMMRNCWNEQPDSRPSFTDISMFLEKLLKGERTPATGSDEGDNYIDSDGRRFTKDIPDDYLVAKPMSQDNEDYITPLRSKPRTSYAVLDIETVGAKGTDLYDEGTVDRMKASVLYEELVDAAPAHTSVLYDEPAEPAPAHASVIYDEGTVDRMKASVLYEEPVEAAPAHTSVLYDEPAEPAPAHASVIYEGPAEPASAHASVLYEEMADYEELK